MKKQRDSWDASGSNGVAGASTPFWRGIVVFGLISAILAGPAAGQCNYSVEVIQAPACGFLGPPNTFPAGMSNNGKVVGRYVICGTAFHEAFLWTPNPDGPGGTFQTLPRPAGIVSASASDVNSAGFVIGSHMFESGGTRGFIFDPQTQEFTYLEPADPGATHGTISTLSALNDNNVAVGSRRISPPAPATYNAVIWHPFGIDGEGPEVVIDLGVGDGPNSGALDGNSSTDAAGWTGTHLWTANAMAMLWVEGEPIALGVLPGATSSHANGTNDNHKVVGSSRDGIFSPFRGFVWHAGVMSEILPPAPYEQFLPGWIANSDQTVGNLVTETGTKAGMWQNNQFYEITPLVVNPPPQFSVSSPKSVNSNGQIGAAGVLGSKTVGVVLTPINVPTGDLSFDCKVDVHDLLYLLSEWGKPGSSADLNGDGTVGVPDLLILLANWGS